MATEKKPLVGRGGMTIDEKGRQRVIGYWGTEQPTDARSWVGRSWKDYKETLSIAQRLHEQNEAVALAKQMNRPPPDTVPDAIVRQQLAKADLKKLSEIKARLGTIDDELMAKRHTLKPYEYENSVQAVMSRQEIRNHLRQMDDAKRREAMRKFEYRQAALETLPELSGLSETMHAALTEEQLRFQHGPAMAALGEAREAHEKALLAHETASLAATNEILAAGGQIKEPAPTKENPPWIKE